MKPRQKRKHASQAKEFYKIKSVGRNKFPSLPSLTNLALSHLLEPTFKLDKTLLLMIQEKYAQTIYTSLKRFIGAFFANPF